MTEPTEIRHPVAAAFGARVRAARQDRKLSQEDLAAATGLHRTYIGTVEQGKRNPGLINIVRLAAALAVDPGELMNWLRPDLTQPNDQSPRGVAATQE